jgi:hypothetical protein
MRFFSAHAILGGIYSQHTIPHASQIWQGLTGFSGHQSFAENHHHDPAPLIAET